MEILELFRYSFFANAFLVGIPLTISAALLGVNLVLKGYSMIGDGLSHTGFGIMSVAMLLNLAPLKISLPIVGIVAFLLLKLNKSHTPYRSDALIALVSVSALAIGYTVTRLSGGSNINISDYMFGSIFTVSGSDVILSTALCFIIIITYILLYNRLFAVTLDEEYAKATGIRAEIYNFILAVMTAVTVVVGMRLMGTLLITGLMIFPAMTSMSVFKSYRGVVIFSAVISVISFVSGMFICARLSTPPGASVVLASLFYFILFKTFSFIRRKG